MTTPGCLRGQASVLAARGQPRVYGPGRGRTDERVMYTVYLLSAAFMVVG